MREWRRRRRRWRRCGWTFQRTSWAPRSASSPALP
jgi:hypothetical protein